MGKNKRYRHKLEGQRRALAEHLEKIEAEQAQPRPNQRLIQGWQKTIENIRRQIEELERRLRG